MGLKAICIALRLCSSLTGIGSVIDGDTVVLDGYHIRLHGVDAEELSEPHGPIAKLVLSNIIGGREITCSLNGDRSYDRYVGTCRIDGVDLARLMIGRGLALDCARFSGGKYRQYEPSDARTYLRQKPYC